MLVTLLLQSAAFISNDMNRVREEFDISAEATIKSIKELGPERPAQ
jgi:hypothetical protein